MISPSELDAAILAQASKAVQAKPQAVTARSHLTLRWGAPIASAALIVLSVTVFIVTPEVEQEQSIQRFEEDLMISADSVATPQELEAKKQAAKQEKKERQRHDVTKTMQKIAPKIHSIQRRPEPSTPITRGKQAEHFSVADDMAMGSLEEQLSSDVISFESVSSAPSRASAMAIILPADVWVKNIRQLIDQKNWKLADKQFKAFTQHYPEHEFNKEYAKLKQE